MTLEPRIANWEGVSCNKCNSYGGDHVYMIGEFTCITQEPGQDNSTPAMAVGLTNVVVLQCRTCNAVMISKTVRSRNQYT